MSHLRDCRAEPETLGFALGNEKPLGIERIEQAVEGRPAQVDPLEQF